MSLTTCRCRTRVEFPVWQTGASPRRRPFFPDAPVAGKTPDSPFASINTDTMGYSHHTEQWLPYPVEAVFAFFADPDNIPALLPIRQQARIEKVSLVPPSNPANPGTTAYAGNGTRLTLSFRPFRYCPLRLRWEAEITEFSWNGQVCYRQVRGPFAWWCPC